MAPMRSRGKIIDATLDLIRTSGFAGITIAAVAEAAGVSRQTVYSIFGTREDLVSQSIAHLTLTATHDIRSRTAATDNTDFLIELVMSGRHFARNTPVLTAMFQADEGNPLFDAGVLQRAKSIALEFLSPLDGVLDDLDDVGESDAAPEPVDRAVRRPARRRVAPPLPTPLDRTRRATTSHRHHRLSIRLAV